MALRAVLRVSAWWRGVVMAVSRGQGRPYPVGRGRIWLAALAVVVGYASSGNDGRSGGAGAGRRSRWRAGAACRDHDAAGRFGAGLCQQSAAQCAARRYARRRRERRHRARRLPAAHHGDVKSGRSSSRHHAGERLRSTPPGRPAYTDRDHARHHRNADAVTTASRPATARGRPRRRCSPRAKRCA